MIELGYDYPTEDTAVEIRAEGTSVTIDPVSNDFVRILLTQPTTDIVLSETPARPGIVTTCNLILKQTVGANKVHWPANIHWAYNQLPSLSFEAAHEDQITLVNFGADNYWYGFLTGGWFNG